MIKQLKSTIEKIMIMTVLIQDDNDSKGYDY